MSDVEVSTRVENGRTVVDVTGTRKAAVVVRDDDGERIYLPPEEFEESPSETASPYGSPYRSAAGDVDRGASPYEGIRGADSPYRSGTAANRSPGTHVTDDGFRVVHEGEATEFSVYR